MRKVKKIKVNIDAEGRLQLPPEIRKELGNNLTLKKRQKATYSPAKDTSQTKNSEK